MKAFIVPLDEKDHPLRNARLMPILDQLKSSIEVLGVERTPYFKTTNIVIKGFKFALYYLNVLIYGYKNRKSIDLIFSETVYFGVIGAILSRIINRPMVLDTHDGNILEHCRLITKSKLFYRISLLTENIAGKVASIIVVCSERDRQLYEKQKFKYLNKIQVIPSGIDITNVDRSKEDKLILRKKLGLNSQNKILIFSGNMNYHLNKEALLWISNELAPVLYDRYDSPQIIVTGAGDVPNGLHPIISYVGFVKEYFKYLFASDIGLVPYEMNTGISTKLIDYLACGIPTICMKSVASLYPELNHDNIFIAGNREEFIDKTIIALDRQDLRLSIGTNGRKVIEKNYSREYVGKLWEIVFELALENK